MKRIQNKGVTPPQMRRQAASHGSHGCGAKVIDGRRPVVVPLDVHKRSFKIGGFSIHTFNFRR